MRILITGGAGFLGSHLADRFLAEGHSVIAMDNLITGNTDNISHLAGRSNFKFIRHDVNGFLVDANPGGLAHGIGSLLANQDHCRSPGTDGRRAVEEKFNWNNVAAYTEGVYQVALR